jgi:hypothetical protein
MAVSPASRPLPINIHGDGQQTDTNRDPSNCKKHIPHALCCHPIVQIVRQPKCKHVLDEIHRCECFARFVAMAVDDVRYHARGPELDAEVDEAEANDDGYFPGILRVGGLAPGEETGRGEEEVCDHDGETELGFCDAVSWSHGSRDVAYRKFRHFSGIVFGRHRRSMDQQRPYRGLRRRMKRDW